MIHQPNEKTWFYKLLSAQDLIFMLRNLPQHVQVTEPHMSILRWTWSKNIDMQAPLG